MSWPKIAMSNCGKKLSTKELQAVDPCRGLDYFEFLKRWNGGTPKDNWFKVLDVFGKPTLAEVKTFFGVNEDLDSNDLRSAVYWNWDYLPRGTLPIAEVEIDGDEYDQSLLVTFRWGPNYNQVFLLANPHECGPEDPELSELQKVSSSLPKFLESLRPREYWLYRAWYKLQVPVDQLKVVAVEFLKNGIVDSYEQFATIQDRSAGIAYYPKIGCGIWLAHSNAQIRNVPAPVRVPSDSCILAIDANRWIHPNAEKFVKTILKSLKLKAVSIGESRVADHKGPYNPFAT
ncbi:MAG: hypothetical protein U0930_20940 [Pirellulales bacterium]